MSGWSVGTANHGKSSWDSRVSPVFAPPDTLITNSRRWNLKESCCWGEKILYQEAKPKLFQNVHSFSHSRLIFYTTSYCNSMKKPSFEDCVYIWLVGVNQAHFFKQPWHKHFVNIDCCHCHFTKLVIKCVLQEDLSFELCALQLSLPQGESVVITSWTYPQYLHNAAYPLFLSLSLHSLQYFDLCF